MPSEETAGSEPSLEEIDLFLKSKKLQDYWNSLPYSIANLQHLPIDKYDPDLSQGEFIKLVEHWGNLRLYIRDKDAVLMHKASTSYRELALAVTKRNLKGGEADSAI